MKEENDKKTGAFISEDIAPIHRHQEEKPKEKYDQKKDDSSLASFIMGWMFGVTTCE